MIATAPLFLDAPALPGRSVRATVYAYYYTPGTGPI